MEDGVEEESGLTAVSIRDSILCGRRICGNASSGDARVVLRLNCSWRKVTPRDLDSRG